MSFSFTVTALIPELCVDELVLVYELFELLLGVVVVSLLLFVTEVLTEVVDDPPCDVVDVVAERALTVCVVTVAR